MRDKWLGDRSAGNLLHHGSLDLDEVMRVEEPPHGLHQFAALQKYLAHLWIHDQIDITLAVAELNVSQAVPLFRQGQQILG